MNALEFCTRNVFFDQQSAISGAFNVSKYPFLRAPLLDLTNPDIREMVVYKAASCCGTVFLQCAMAFRICRELGNLFFVAQTDDDSKQWTKTRGKEFLLRIPEVEKMLRSKTLEKYPVTQGEWIFVNKFMVVTGPSEDSLISKQVRFLFSDESHRFEKGVLSKADDRMQNASLWNRAALHVTTAPNAGHDIDLRYLQGQQNEWHNRCIHCGKLIWALWGKDAEEHYNGERVFVWKDSLSETEMLDSCHANCPHCGKDLPNEDRVRIEGCEAGDFVAMNPNAVAAQQSYRWDWSACSWINYREVLRKWLAALAAAKLGNLEPYQTFVKQTLCKCKELEIPDFNTVAIGRDYKMSEVSVIAEDRIRTASFDVQDKGGLFFYGLASEFKTNGESRRICYKRLETWPHVLEFAQYHHAKPEHCAIDATGQRNREVMLRCAMWKWLAFIVTNETQFQNEIHDKRTGLLRYVPNPYYGNKQPENPHIGSHNGVKTPRLANNRLPIGWAISRKWSKPNVGFLLLRLKAGELGRYYGIAQDIGEAFVSQINSYYESIVEVKKTGERQRVLKQVKEQDHAFSCASQELVVALSSGFFPLDFSAMEKENAA